MEPRLTFFCLYLFDVDLPLLPVFCNFFFLTLLSKLAIKTTSYTCF
nr:MAG TPA: hypothetical protein [Caudoviricetes sp.]